MLSLGWRARLVILTLVAPFFMALVLSASYGCPGVDLVGQGSHAPALTDAGVAGTAEFVEVNATFKNVSGDLTLNMHGKFEYALTLPATMNSSDGYLLTGTVKGGVGATDLMIKPNASTRSTVYEVCARFCALGAAAYRNESWVHAGFAVDRRFVGAVIDDSFRCFAREVPTDGSRTWCCAITLGVSTLKLRVQRWPRRPWQKCIV